MKIEVLTNHHLLPRLLTPMQVTSEAHGDPRAIRMPSPNPKPMVFLPRPLLIQCMHAAAAAATEALYFNACPKRHSLQYVSLPGYFNPRAVNPPQIN